jgi:hypothetical protein
VAHFILAASEIAAWSSKTHRTVVRHPHLLMGFQECMMAPPTLGNEHLHVTRSWNLFEQFVICITVRGRNVPLKWSEWDTPTHCLSAIFDRAPPSTPAPPPLAAPLPPPRPCSASPFLCVLACASPWSYPSAPHLTVARTRTSGWCRNAHWPDECCLRRSGLFFIKLFSYCNSIMKDYV